MTDAPTKSRLGWLVIAAAVIWHLFTVLSPPKVPPPPNTEGRDFASYYYAARVAAGRGDPYDKAALEAVSSAEGTRTRVHPFFYPPPFLLLVWWSPFVSLAEGFRLWAVLNELALIAAGLALWRAWRPLGPVLPLFAAFAALMYGVAYGFELGQANLPVLALVLAGLWAEPRRPALAGALVGFACLLKMSPALIVAWWLLRRRWTAAGSAVVSGGLLSLATLPLLGPGHQLAFYTEVLPRFGSGDYNGLTIKIEMFANHSIPNLLHQAFPSGQNVLSATARAGSAVATLGLLGGLGLAFARPTTDRLRLAAQASAVLLATLLIPVYTYEHHLVFALPAMVLAPLAIRRGALTWAWAAPLGVAVALLLVDLPALKQFATDGIGEQNRAAFLLVQEAKFLALVALLAGMVAAGRTTGRAEPAGS